MKLKHWKLGLIAALFSGSLYAAPLEVVSSFSILGDVAKQVGGERVNVSNLVGPDQDAHAYNLTSRDMQRIRNAKLVLVNGLGFEQAAVMRGIRQSGVPFAGPIGAARVGYANGQYLLNPSKTELATSQLDLVVAGTQQAVLMVESEANILPEDVMLGAVVFGHEQMQAVINAINELADEVNPEVWDWKAPETNAELVSKVREIAGETIAEAFKIRQKQARSAKLDEAWAAVEAALINEETDTLAKNEIKGIFKQLEADVVRGQILAGQPRIDGRDTRTVRPINIQTNVLPRTHGSALFTRGETQALAVATLGTSRDEQIIDALSGEYTDRFMLHYNFPPYSTGEVGRVGAPKRREIGHGRLAKRALVAVLPDPEDFNYTMRVVSEITESNGSSSMASVCGGCLSLLSAGVPLKAHVAGIAMGLILEDNKFAVLTDILGDEDHLGDMDFKVAGTTEGVTALQMDIKIQGITKEIMQIALAQAKEARLHILSQMQAAVAGPQELSQHAPRLYTMRINPDKIREVIGKGGETIRSITAETHTEINISDDGVVTIAATTAEAGEAAKARIEMITAEVEVGKVYEGTVVKILDNNVGAIVSVMPGKDGLVHISQIAHERVKDVNDYLKVGQVVNVKALDVDERGRVRLSIRALLPQPERSAPAQETEAAGESSAE